MSEINNEYLVELGCLATVLLDTGCNGVSVRREFVIEEDFKVAWVI